MTHVDTGAPICFGAITRFAVDSDSCTACASFADCKIKVEENIAEVAQIMDIYKVLEKHAKLRKPVERKPKPPKDSSKLKEKAPADPQVGQSMQAMAIKQFVIRSMSPVEDVRAALVAGENPFDASSCEQWVVCELLRRGPVSRAVIEAAVAKLSTTARAAVYCDALIEAGLIQADDERVQVVQL